MYIHFRKKTPEIFRFVILLLEKKLSTLQILHTGGENFKVKKQDPWKFREFFMNTPGQFD